MQVNGSAGSGGDETLIPPEPPRALRAERARSPAHHP